MRKWILLFEIIWKLNDSRSNICFNKDELQCVSIVISKDDTCDNLTIPPSLSSSCDRVNHPLLPRPPAWHAYEKALLFTSCAMLSSQYYVLLRLSHKSCQVSTKLDVSSASLPKKTSGKSYQAISADGWGRLGWHADRMGSRTAPRSAQLLWNSQRWRAQLKQQTWYLWGIIYIGLPCLLSSVSSILHSQSISAVSMGIVLGIYGELYLSCKSHRVV